MRLTVGPLPPSVYWWRRALVLGVLALIVFGIVYAVGGGDGDDPGPSLSVDSANSTMPSATVTPTPTAYTLPVGTATTVPTTTASATITGDACRDSEILLTATSTPASLKVNETATFTLRIKNISDRTCVRDTGSRPQELRLLRDDMVVWSSDDCASGEPYDFDQVFVPDFEKVFDITWDGFRSRDNDGNKTCGSPQIRPDGGEYELVARLGTLFSEPAPVTIRSGS